MNILQMSAQAGLFIIFVVIILSITLGSLPKKTFVVLLSTCIAFVRIRDNLSNEPLKLLSMRETE